MERILFCPLSSISAMGIFAPVAIFASTWHEYSKVSTVCGVCNAGTAKSGFRRSCWMLLFMSGLAGTIWAVAILIQSFLTYPISTTISLEKLEKIKFPGVTVCNQNRIDCSKLTELINICQMQWSNCTITDNRTMDSLRRLKENGCPDSADASNNTSGNGGGNNNGTTNQTMPSGNGTDTNGNPLAPVNRRKRQANQMGGGGGNGPPPLSQLGNTPDNVDAEYKFLVDYMSLFENERQMIGHAFSDLIKSCTFRQRDCLNESNFLLTSSPNYGNCYTFNSANNTQDEFPGTRVTSMSGPSFGLQLVLDLDQKNYLLNGRTEQAGARLVVQDPSNRPLTDEYGYDVTPNTLTNVALQQLTLNRLPAPYASNCSSYWNSTPYSDNVPQGLGWNYSLALCNRICLQTSFEAECNCFHPLYLDSDVSRHNLGPCNLASSTIDTNCTTNIIEAFDNGTRSCSCNVNCNENGYELALSQSTWPSVQYYETAMGLYGYGEVLSGAPTGEENLLQIQVYFMTLNVQNITETPVYSWSDGSYISAFGGSLGLFLGVAIVSIFEIFEFLVDYFINLSQYCMRGKLPEKAEREVKKDKGGIVAPIVPYSAGFDYKKPRV